MDNFLDKINKTWDSEDVIRANSEAEAREMERIRGQIAEYDERLKELRTLNLKNLELASQIQDYVKESQEKLSEYSLAATAGAVQVATAIPAPAPEVSVASSEPEAASSDVSASEPAKEFRTLSSFVKTADEAAAEGNSSTVSLLASPYLNRSESGLAKTSVSSDDNTNTDEAADTTAKNDVPASDVQKTASTDTTEANIVAPENSAADDKTASSDEATKEEVELTEEEKAKAEEEAAKAAEEAAIEAAKAANATKGNIDHLEDSVTELSNRHFGDIMSQIHKEGVMVYRNVQAVVENSARNTQNTVKAKKEKRGGIIALLVMNLLVSAGALGTLILHILGVL
ncbi:MAG: hypothetical protein KBS85_07690 [Lachnospiraceae bacterium]|nr:hypothetical protein [Candidatus Merdinaster equi]